MVQYENMCTGTFLSRPNRLVTLVELTGNWSAMGSMVL